MRSPLSRLMALTSYWCRWQKLSLLALGLTLVLGCCLSWIYPAPALAGLTDDRYDGDIFALYAGNGSLVPPKVTLAEALKRDRPTMLVFYVDDSSDCKEYSLVVSQTQALYGRAIDILALRVDALPQQQRYEPTEAGYYYKGSVPQTVLFDASGKVVLNEIGKIEFEPIDDVFRKLFDLLPRAESVQLKRRPVNEINTELVRQ